MSLAMASKALGMLSTAEATSDLPAEAITHAAFSATLKAANALLTHEASTPCKCVSMREDVADAIAMPLRFGSEFGASQQRHLGSIGAAILEPMKQLAPTLGSAHAAGEAAAAKASQMSALAVAAAACLRGGGSHLVTSPAWGPWQEAVTESLMHLNARQPSSEDVTDNLLCWTQLQLAAAGEHILQLAAVAALAALERKPLPTLLVHLVLCSYTAPSAMEQWEDLREVADSGEPTCHSDARKWKWL